MFIQNFKYTLKILFKNKMLIFWTFAFPIILGTLFQMAFSDIEKSESFQVIDIAIVENDSFENNPLFKESFKALGDSKNEDRLFNIQYTSNLEEANKLLDKDKIVGYLLLEERPKVVVKKSGVNQTILKYVTEEIIQQEDIIKTLVENKMMESSLQGEEINSFYEELYIEALEMMNTSRTNIKDTTSDHLSYTMIEFYTLIAMACLYGGILGMVAINQNLANMSSNGKRVAISPVSKMKLVFSSALASYVTQLIGIILLFIYTIVVLKVDYGTHLLQVILLSLAGCFAGLSLGIAISCLVKQGENVKTGIIISVTMVGCFLSGMMGITMKYIIDKNIPILNQINPANMITDGFYSLYYYDTFDRFFKNFIGLIIFSLIMILLSIYSLRRQKYDSI